MTSAISMLRNQPEIIVQYSTDVIYLMDPVFQKARTIARSLQSVSESDSGRLRVWAMGSYAYAIVAPFLSILLLGSYWLAKWHLFFHGTFLSGLIGMSLAVLSLSYIGYMTWRDRLAIFPITGIGISADGLSIYHGKFSIGVNRHHPWEAISDIRVVQDIDHKNKRETLLQIRDLSGKISKLRVNAIRSIEERKLLVEAFITYARRAVDPHDINRLVRISEAQDLPFTQLWSQALRSSAPRNASSVLKPFTLLQNGQFLIKQQIGGGGQGAIYLAEMLDSFDQKSEVALKEYILPDQEHLFDRKRAIEKFEREVHLLARLQHKSLAELVDAFVEDHRAYLAIEYLDGINLRELVRQSGPLSQELCRRISLQLCDVLCYLHTLDPPVVHLDLSPENVILLPDQSIKLIDFNTSSDGSSLRTKLIAGKQRYMPPEQYRNDISPQCDIYSFGCTIFFMLTGTEPEPLTVLHPQQKVPSLDPILEQLVSEATSLNLETRTRSAEEMKQKLMALNNLELRSGKN